MAARGLDIDNIDCVIHMGCKAVDSFVHRSGRTGRAGKSGKNFVFSTNSELPQYLKYGRDLKIKMNIGNSLLTELPTEQRVKLDINWVN